MPEKASQTDSTRPRKRAVKRTAAKSPATKTTTRRRATTSRSSESTNEKSEGTARKAPTPVGKQTTQDKKHRYVQVAALLFLVVMFGSSVAIGMSDAGVIDVRETIEENVRSRPAGEASANVSIPDTSGERRKNSGLVGGGKPNRPPAPAPETASTSASTTDDTATSTATAEADEADNEQEAAPEGSTAPETPTDSDTATATTEAL